MKQFLFGALFMAALSLIWPQQYEKGFEFARSLILKSAQTIVDKNTTEEFQ